MQKEAEIKDHVAGWRVKVTPALGSIWGLLPHLPLGSWRSHVPFQKNPPCSLRSFNSPGQRHPCLLLIICPGLYKFCVFQLTSLPYPLVL